MTAQTQACLERVPGTLERGGLAIYCGEWVDVYRCVTCRDEYLAPRGRALTINGWLVSLCPWCRTDSKPWINGRGI
ncbi:MAG: hypothetical protein VW362_02500 [Candidatus Nanopelagicales bacterium]